MQDFKDLYKTEKEAALFVNSAPRGVTVFGSAREKSTGEYYKKAYHMGAIFAKNGIPIITGGGPGVMEAANKGCLEAGGISVGINIALPLEQNANPYITNGFKAENFSIRKSILIYLSRACVFFPGGFGTLDELTEITTLVQTQKIPPIPMALVGGKFWNGFLSWSRNTLAEAGYISRDEADIFRLFDETEEAANFLLEKYALAI